MTFADLLAICELTQTLAHDLDLGNSGRPRLQAWMGRVKQELGTTFDDAHIGIQYMRKAYLKARNKSLL